MKFKTIDVPGLGLRKIPEDVSIIVSTNPILVKKQSHSLVEIPWDNKYLRNIPAGFVESFKIVLPKLHVRCTDVHTAISFSFFDCLLDKYNEEKIDKEVIGLALILHDVGWSKLTDEEIALSLGTKGVKVTKESLGPKEKHLVEGVKLAKGILDEYFTALSQEKKDLILKAILYHDKPEFVNDIKNTVPLEVKLLIDLDHLWSFTHEDFWLDTIRKNVDPLTYAKNIEKDIDTYFITKEGKIIARKLLEKRFNECLLYK